VRQDEKDRDQEDQDRQGSSPAFWGIFPWQTNWLQITATCGIKYTSI